jgi:small subunit ribosomal protein S16
VGVVIRLQRAGNRNRPFYRVVVTDSRKQRDGAFLEKVGYYNPIPNPEEVHLERDRVDSWIGKGAKPTTAVASLIKRFDKRPQEAEIPTPEPAAASDGDSE